MCGLAGVGSGCCLGGCFEIWMGCSAGTHLGAGGFAVGAAGLFGGLVVAGSVVVCDW